MEIQHAQNPLYSKVILDDSEQELLRLKVKINELEDIIAFAHHHATHRKDGDEAAVEALAKVVNAIDMEYIFDGKLDERVETLTSSYIEDLLSLHIGDCTCVACTCSKCLAEGMLGIDTIPGLRKHEANKIAGAFGVDNKRTCAEAIAWMEQHPPTVTEDWHKPHIERWTVEYRNALEWLKNYQTFLNGE